MKDKISFILCSNDIEQAREVETYLRRQYLPLDIEAECCFIFDAVSIAEGYNRAMENSDAKYKVYLHQDVFLVYEKAIFQCLKIFRENPGIGMIGLIGSKGFAEDGCWWQGGELYGRVIDNHINKMEASTGFKNEKEFAEVKMLDGFFLMTQYDVRWREEIFDGWHFYDAAQCQEFIRKGFKLAVPYQEIPWCVHSCGVSFSYLKEYELYRSRYLKEYVITN